MHPKHQTFITAVCCAALAAAVNGCRSGIQADVSSKNAAAPESAGTEETTETDGSSSPGLSPASSIETAAVKHSDPKISAISSITAKPGETVTVTGQYLTGQSVEINGQKIALTRVSADGTTAEFIWPADAGLGLVAVSVAGGSQSDSKFAIVGDTTDNDLPIFIGVPEAVCDDLTYLDAKGVERTGKRDCRLHAAAPANLPDASKVLVGTAFGTGLVGTYAPDFPDAANVRASDTVDGVAGTLSNCAADGAINCVANASFPAAKLNIANLNAANIRSGVSIAGVTGGYPSTIYPLATADSGVDDLAAPTFNTQLATSSAAFEWFTSAGVRQTRAGEASLVSSNIVSNATIFGVTGNAASGPNVVYSQDFSANDNGLTPVAGNWTYANGRYEVTTSGGITGFASIDHLPATNHFEVRMHVTPTFLTDNEGVEIAIEDSVHHVVHCDYYGASQNVRLHSNNAVDASFQKAEYLNGDYVADLRVEPSGLVICDLNDGVAAYKYPLTFPITSITFGGFANGSNGFFDDITVTDL